MKRWQTRARRSWANSKPPTRKASNLPSIPLPLNSSRSRFSAAEVATSYGQGHLRRARAQRFRSHPHAWKSLLLPATRLESTRSRSSTCWQDRSSGNPARDSSASRVERQRADRAAERLTFGAPGSAKVTDGDLSHLSRAGRNRPRAGGMIRKAV